MDNPVLHWPTLILILPSPLQQEKIYQCCYVCIELLWNWLQPLLLRFLWPKDTGLFLQFLMSILLWVNTTCLQKCYSKYALLPNSGTKCSWCQVTLGLLKFFRFNRLIVRPVWVFSSFQCGNQVGNSKSATGVKDAAQSRWKCEWNEHCSSKAVVWQFHSTVLWPVEKHKNSFQQAVVHLICCFTTRPPLVLLSLIYFLSDGIIPSMSSGR